MAHLAKTAPEYQCLRLWYNPMHDYQVVGGGSMGGIVQAFAPGAPPIENYHYCGDTVPIDHIVGPLL